MTLLSIVNDIADETNGPRPASVAGNTNPDAQKYFRIVNKVGFHLMRVYNWNILRKEFSFNAPGTETLLASASFPSDFDRFVPETFWDRGRNNLLSGPIDPVEWQGLKTYNPNINNTKWVYRGGDVLTNPVVDTNNECAFEYVSNQYVQDSGGSPQTSFQADTDVSILDEELITRGGRFMWLKSENQPYADAFEDFKSYFDMLQDNEDATARIAVTGDIFTRNSRHFNGAPAASQTQYFGSY